MFQSYSQFSQYPLHLLLFDDWVCILYSLLDVSDFSRPLGVHFILSEFPQKVITCRWIRLTWSSFSEIMHCGSIVHTTFMAAIIVWAPAQSCWSDMIMGCYCCYSTCIFFKEIWAYNPKPHWPTYSPSGKYFWPQVTWIISVMHVNKHMSTEHNVTTLRGAFTF